MQRIQAHIIERGPEGAWVPDTQGRALVEGWGLQEQAIERARERLREVVLREGLEWDEPDSWEISVRLADGEPVAEIPLGMLMGEG